MTFIGLPFRVFYAYDEYTQKSFVYQDKYYIFSLVFERLFIPA